MTKSKVHITINVRGTDWTFMLLTDRAFDKLHVTSGAGDTNTAMTIESLHEVHFRQSDWCVRDIRHELGHVFKASRTTVSTTLTVDNIEEVFCDIIGEHLSEIQLLTDKIAEKFFGR
jgi:hypothetical protein